MNRKSASDRACRSGLTGASAVVPAGADGQTSLVRELGLKIGRIAVVIDVPGMVGARIRGPSAVNDGLAGEATWSWMWLREWGKLLWPNG